MVNPGSASWYQRPSPSITSWCPLPEGIIGKQFSVECTTASNRNGPGLAKHRSKASPSSARRLRLWASQPKARANDTKSSSSAPALGYRDVFIVQVTLESHSDDMLAAFGRALADIPEVTEALLVSGDYDNVLRVVVKDTRDYERLLREKLYKISGIRHSRSSVVLRSLKSGQVPLPVS